MVAHCSRGKIYEQLGLEQAFERIYDASAPPSQTRQPQLHPVCRRTSLPLCSAEVHPEVCWVSTKCESVRLTKNSELRKIRGNFTTLALPAGEQSNPKFLQCAGHSCHRGWSRAMMRRYSSSKCIDVSETSATYKVSTTASSGEDCLRDYSLFVFISHYESKMYLTHFLALVLSITAFASHNHVRQSMHNSHDCSPANSSTMDASRFSSAVDIRRITSRICQGGLRLPGSPDHLSTVDYIRQHLARIPGLEIEESSFQLANWQPVQNSMYTSAHLQVEGEKVDVASAIAYSLPTNGSAVSGTSTRFQ